MKHWDRSVAVLGLIALTIALVNEALTFGAGDNQYLRFALWIEITIASMAALIFFTLALNDFGIRLLSEPSTYLSVLAVLLTAVFCVIRREHISWESVGTYFQNLSNVEMLILAIINVLIVFSLMLNIRATNVLFGIVLTVVQMALSVLLLLLVALLVLLAADHKTAHRKKKNY